MSDQKKLTSYFGSSSPRPGPGPGPGPSQTQQQPRLHPGPARPNHSERRERLKGTAAETRAVLPAVLARLPALSASTSELAHLESLTPLAAAACPRHPGTRVRVINADSFTAAIDLARAHAGPGKAPGEDKSARPAVLNLASPTNPGGGWTTGALAQEEALCYRSSLALSLHRRYYPFRQLTALYTPDVLVIRDEMAAGHALYTCPAADMPVVSVVSVAGLVRPQTKRVAIASAAGGPPVMREVFAAARDRDLTKGKMRVGLRLAAARGHDMLVLGALGCGAFLNPPGEVVACWKEVLGESEFAGGWWREVVFAVLDNKGETNFDLFDEALSGLEV